MKLETAILAVAGVALLGAAWWIGLGSELGPSLVLVLFLFVVSIFLGTKFATNDDPWLRTLFPVFFVLKMLGAFARWVMVEFLYGFGDSVSYHLSGLTFASSWRAGEVPDIIGRSMGTRFVENVTALLYTPYEPHMLGGFFEFAVISFIGQTLFYLAYRRAFGGRNLKLMAWFVFALPTLAFWPSSIGKDALMIFFLGVTFYGAARFFDKFGLRFVALMGAGLWGAAVIRSHVALLTAASIFLTVLLMRKPTSGLTVSFRRLAFIGVALLGSVAVATVFATTFGLDAGGDGILSIDLSLEDLDPVISDIERRTGQGGSKVDAGAVGSLTEVPAAFARVLFAPFLWQSRNAVTLLSALEGTVLIGLFLWGLPSIFGALGQYRRNPYLMLSLIYTLGFTVAFSAIRNVGIITRQRAQVIALFLVLCIGARAVTQRRPRADTPAEELIAG